MTSLINASTSAGVVITPDTSGVLALQTAGTTAVTVDASQNVGIGTNSPAAKLDVTATLRAVSSTPVAPTSGKGVEIWYETSGDYGRIATYDRTGAAYKNQYIDGAALYLNSQSSGNVGIGTASPQSALQVSGAMPVSPTGNGIHMGITTSNTCMQFNAGSGNVSLIDFSTSGTDYLGRILYDNTGNSMQFSTNTTERMRIDSSGNLLVGTTSSSGRFTLKGSGATSGTSSIYVTNSTPVYTFVVNDDGSFYTGASPAGAPYNSTTGTGANLVVTSAGQLQRSTSSLKYKTDVQDATHGLADALKLRAVTYKGKNDGDTIFGGLIAEEVHEAGLTEFVQYAEDGSPDALSYGNMVSLCIKAIQEQQALITQLQADVAALKGK
jgi:hypothetical protein